MLLADCAPQGFTLHRLITIRKFYYGSATMFLNSSGNRTSELLYSPWGENRFTYGLPPSTFQYTGQRNDSGVAGGLYYYGARYFDSAVGRFISADTAVPGAGNAMAWDRYAYTFNSPVNLVDDDGHEPHGPGVPDGYDQYGFGDVPSNDWWAYSCATIDTRIMDSVSNSPEFIQTIVEAAIAPESLLSGYLHVSFSQIEILSGDFEQGFHDLAVSVGANLYNGSIGLAVGGDIQAGGVYSLRNPDGLVVRVGRTSDFARRAGEYSRDPNFFDLEFHPEYTTNNYFVQRGLEQMIYDEYNPPLNSIRPISVRNPNITNYLNYATDFLFGFFGTE